MNKMTIPENNDKDINELSNDFVNASNLAINAYKTEMERANTPEERMYYAEQINRTRRETQIFIFLTIGSLAVVALAKYYAKK